MPLFDTPTVRLLHVILPWLLPSSSAAKGNRSGSATSSWGTVFMLRMAMKKG